MSSTLTLPDPADRARQRDEDAQYYRQVLHKFIAMGTDLAEAVHRQALAEPAAAPAPQSQPEDEPAAPSPTPSQATTFDRLARTVRRTIALARKLSEPAREAPGPKLHLKECPLEECPKQRRTDLRRDGRPPRRAVRAPRGTRFRRRRGPRRRPRRAVACRPDREHPPRHRSRHPVRRRALAAPHAPKRASERPKRDVRPLRPSRSDPPEGAPEGAPAERVQGRRANERAAQDHSINPWHPAPRHRPASSLIRTPGATQDGACRPRPTAAAIILPEVPPQAPSATPAAAAARAPAPTAAPRATPDQTRPAPPRPAARSRAPHRATR